MAHDATLPGIDLGLPENINLTRKIFMSKFARKARFAGLDPDDVLQKVFLGILTRNAGKSRWDPARASKPTYLFWVCRSVLLNAIDHKRVEDETGGKPGTQDDAASWEGIAGTVEALGEREQMEAWEDAADEVGVSVEVLRAVASGETAFSAALMAGESFFSAAQIDEIVRIYAAENGGKGSHELDSALPASPRLHHDRRPRGPVQGGKSKEPIAKIVLDGGGLFDLFGEEVEQGEVEDV